MNLTTILIAVLVLVLLGAVPAWPHSRSWGYGPSGIVGVLLAIMIVLALVHPV
jgi:flagellin-like protein